MLPMIIQLVTKLVILNICYKNKIIAKQNNNVPNIYTKYIYFLSNI